ncbi:MAG TPA: hypothetical protein DCY58_12915, partial [Acetobacterium sp.]|nr:hypothetical protein [Acetobacterium sp.]
LLACGIQVTLVERAGKLTPNLDEDMSQYLEKLLKQKAIPILKNANVVEATAQGVVLEDGSLVPGEMIIVATGVKPNVSLAREAGLLLGVTGALRVDERMMTIDTIFMPVATVSRPGHRSPKNLTTGPWVQLPIKPDGSAAIISLA